MPINFGPEPHQGRSIVQTAILDINNAKGVLTPRGVRQEISKPIEVYSIQLNDLAASNASNYVKNTGWIYVLTENDETAQVIELYADEMDSTVRFGKIESTDSAKHLLEAIRCAEIHIEALTGNYVLRELRVPGICFRAVWLTSIAGSTDFVCPIVPLGPNLIIESIYTLDEIFSELQKLDLDEMQAGFEPTEVEER